MTMKKVLLNTLALVMIFSASLSFGQSRSIRDMILDPEKQTSWMLGVFGGIDYNIHHGGFTTTENSIICCVASDGTGVGAALGIKAFIPLSDNFSITPRILYEGRNGTFTAAPENYPILGKNNQVENLVLTKQFKATIATMGADLFVAWYLTENGLYLAGGPSVAAIVSKHFMQTEHIETPGGVTYLGGSPDATVLDSDLDITKSLQVLLKLGVGYQIHVSDKFTVNPEALYGFALTKFSKTYDWAGNALQLTVGLLYSF